MNDEAGMIISEMRRVDAMLYKNRQLFDLAEDPSDIDALIYEQRALEIRQSALIEKAKKLGIRREVIQWK